MRRRLCLGVCPDVCPVAHVTITPLSFSLFICLTASAGYVLIASRALTAGFAWSQPTSQPGGRCPCISPPSNCQAAHTATRARRRSQHGLSICALFRASCCCCTSCNCVGLGVGPAARPKAVRGIAFHSSAGRICRMCARVCFIWSGLGVSPAGGRASRLASLLVQVRDSALDVFRLPAMRAAVARGCCAGIVTCPGGLQSHFSLQNSCSKELACKI